MMNLAPSKTHIFPILKFVSVIFSFHVLLLLVMNGSCSAETISGTTMEVNVQPANKNSTDILTIYELVMLSKLQKYGEDMMGVRKFQEPFWVSSAYLTNLLDASQWDLKKAKRKFHKMMEWRLTNLKLTDGVSTESLHNSFNFEVQGHDTEGCPVIVVPFGEWRTYRSFAEKIKSIHTADMQLKLYLTHFMEQLLRKVSRNLLCSRFTLIADMEKYTRNHSSGIRFFTDAIKQFDKLYPGILKETFLINSSPDFLKDAQFFKSTIPWDLRRRSFIFTERKFWEEAILNKINPSQIAPKYGGSSFLYD